MIASIWPWVGFALFILAMLALDLGVFHRKAQPVSSKEALGWTAIWVTLALLFGAGVWHFAGQEKALEFSIPAGSSNIRSAWTTSLSLR